MLETDNVTILPIWKNGATPEERLAELSFYARKNPERFGKLIVIYEETLPNKLTVLRWMADKCSTNELLGILEIAKDRILKDTETRV